MNWTEVREAFVEMAYADIANEKALTVQHVGERRAKVPPHWREEAEKRALPYIELAIEGEKATAERLHELDALIQRGEASDGHHTHNELYDFRMVYNALLFNAWHRDGYAQVVKSRYHHDGERVFGGGWFIVQAILPTGAQVSNHYREAHWDKFAIPAVDRPEEWDGHSAKDVLYRLTTLAMLENSAESHAAGAAEQIRHPGGKDGWWLSECIHPGCDYQAVESRPEKAEARVNQHATAKNRSAS